VTSTDLIVGCLRLVKEKKYKRLGKSLLYYQRVIAYKSRV
jgi:hypothetical protein